MYQAVVSKSKYKGSVRQFRENYERKRWYIDTYDNETQTF